MTLDINRADHVSWTPSPLIGTYLMGGWHSPMDTTLIKPDGSQEPGFNLKFDLEYVYTGWQSISEIKYCLTVTSF